MTNQRSSLQILACVLLLAGFALAEPKSPKSKATSDKIPITTSSDEAKQAYLKGRDLAERLRITDAHAFYQKAASLDPNFALAYVGLANTSGTAKEFIDATTHAVTLAPKVSEGERHLILGLEAAMKGVPEQTLAHYTALVKLFPNDERARTLLGNTYFGRQDYQTAIQHLEKATQINPSFTAPYNQLGYAYRFVERYDDAEKTFKKYTELIPDDPNPYDSYAELLMKMGRFDESIKNYEKALSIDPNFVASYIGTGNDYLYMGRPEDARAAFANIDKVARNTGEHRTAHLWTAASYVHEGKTDEAIKEIKAGYALAEAENDAASMSGDYIQIGDILREAGRYDEALSNYRNSVTIQEKAQLPEAVKNNTRRNLIFEEGRVAVLRSDLPTAKSKLAEYTKEVALTKAPFQLRQQHELAGMIDAAEKHNSEAAVEFKQANLQDPRVLYMASQAFSRSGQSAEAAKYASKAAKFNGLSFNYAYIRNKTEKEEAQAKD